MTEIGHPALALITVHPKRSRIGAPAIPAKAGAPGFREHEGELCSRDARTSGPGTGTPERAPLRVARLLRSANAPPHQALEAVALAKILDRAVGGRLAVKGQAVVDAKNPPSRAPLVTPLPRYRGRRLCVPSSPTVCRFQEIRAATGGRQLQDGACSISEQGVPCKVQIRISHLNTTKLYSRRIHMRENCSRTQL